MSTVTPVKADETLWAALKQGGKVVLMRHAQVDRSKGNGTRHTPDDCSKEFNLSPAGRAQAKKVGELFRKHGIAIGDVLASPYCRTMDTAKLAFGKAKASEALRLIEALPPAQAEQITAQAMKLIGEYRGKGNLVLVTHEPNIIALAFETVETGGMFVLIPKGADQFDVLGRLTVHRD
ncbi:MAG: histidine phosphatase family protein [Gammaproteobacteria bacterium]|nr:MAG: histidine phosphatase family protein [Gammaproteobacteria bacterium]